MSKVIRLTDEILQEAQKGWQEMLKIGKFPDGKISYTYNFGNVDRKAKLIFTELAWLKMHALVNEFSTEIAWNGVATRGENDDYYIKDIVVFPQFVTGTTVERDKEEYAKWNITLDDETFKSIRMHGHSHVNMGVSPSATDLTFYKDEILAELGDEDFYIFVIWNKKNEKTVKIYDYGKNIMFDTLDVLVEIQNNDIGVKDIISDAKDKLKNKPASTAVTTNTYKPAASTTPSYTPNNVGTTATEEDRKKYKRKDVSSSYSYSGYGYSGYGYGGAHGSDVWDYDYDDDYSYYGHKGYTKGR